MQRPCTPPTVQLGASVGCLSGRWLLRIGVTPVAVLALLCCAHTTAGETWRTCPEIAEYQAKHSGALLLQDVSTPPKPLSPSPLNTSEFTRRLAPAVTCLLLVITSTGETLDPRIVTPRNFRLMPHEKEALRAWRHRPARRDGQAVDVVYVLKITRE